MAGRKTFQGVPVAPEKALKRERNFKPGYTGQQDKYGLDVPSKDLNDYYNPSGTYSLMNGGDNTLTPHLKKLREDAWAKYEIDSAAAEEKKRMDLAAAEEKKRMDLAAAEENKRMMNNIKKRHPNLIQKLNDKFRAVSNISVAEKPVDETRVVRGNLFGNFNNIPPKRPQRKTLRKSQRRQKKTRRQRK
jgi:hypothetical protein